MYYVYILKSSTKQFTYTGLTKNLQKRYKEHQEEKCPVTKPYLPIKIIWYCAFVDKLKAAYFEKYLKSGSGRAFLNKHLI